MLISNGFATDDNGNKWDMSLFTEEEVMEKSKTMIDCNNCVNCNNCNDCKGSENCNNCVKCENCNRCNNCNGCVDCENCDGCIECIDSADCKNCTDCYNQFDRNGLLVIEKNKLEKRYMNEKLLEQIIKYYETTAVSDSLAFGTEETLETLIATAKMPPEYHELLGMR